MIKSLFWALQYKSVYDDPSIVDGSMRKISSKHHDKDRKASTAPLCGFYLKCEFTAHIPLEQLSRGHWAVAYLLGMYQVPLSERPFAE